MIESISCIRVILVLYHHPIHKDNDDDYYYGRQWWWTTKRFLFFFSEKKSIVSICQGGRTWFVIESCKKKKKNSVNLKRKDLDGRFVRFVWTLHTSLINHNMVNVCIIHKIGNQILIMMMMIINSITTLFCLLHIFVVVYEDPRKFLNVYTRLLLLLSIYFNIDHHLHLH